MQVIFLILLLLPSLTFAHRDVLGPTYPIIEKNFLVFIKEKIATLKTNGKLDTMKKDFIEKAKENIVRPTPVKGLSKADETKTYLYDPTVIISTPILDDKGHILVPAGTHVNPLERVGLSKSLLFFDGDDKAQVNWAFREIDRLEKATLILVSGNVFTLAKRFEKAVYFDQGGNIMRHFNLAHVPARIEQEGLMLRITEVKL